MSVKRRGLDRAKIKVYPSTTVKAGVLAGATYPAAMIKNAKTGATRPDPRAGMAVATIAAALEYGHSTAPPRPFMQTAVAKERTHWVADMRKLLVSGATPNETLSTVGLVMKEDIKQAIADWPADNSEEWAAVKGFNHGLIQTGHLMSSIESEIESGKP